jgi:hypothetical protein
MSSGRGLKVVIGALVVALVATTSYALTERGRAVDAGRDARRLEAELDDTSRRLGELRDELAGDSADGSDGAGSGNLEDVLGEGFAGLAECLGTDELLAGGGDLDDLLEGADDSRPEAPGRVQIRRIMRAVERIRKLDFKHRVDATFLPRVELAKRAADLLLSDYPRREAAIEARMLEALGAIPFDSNLRAVTKDLLESQVAGFYVPKTNELFVPGNPDEPMSAVERTIMAHELEHAVSDQRLGIPLPDDPSPSKIDESIATLSVVEGDATLTMQRYTIAEIPVFEQLSLLNDASLANSEEALERVPHYLQQQLTFPYLSGLEFTCDLYARGGWKAVDKAYDHPPTTTAEILFPERYRAREGEIDVRDPNRPRGFDHLFDSSFGAANLMWLFEAPGGDETKALNDPKERVSSWAGGEVRLWSSARDHALGLALVERRGSDGLCRSITEWYDAAFDDSEVETERGEQLARDGDRQDAVVWCSEDEVRLGIGPDIETARAVVR